MSKPTQTSLHALFLAAGVEYAVVGGVAVIAHGYLRTTNDLDLFIRPTVDNAKAAFSALEALGIALGDLEPGDLLSDEDHLRFRADEEYVDVLSSIGEMSFDQVWRNRVYGQIEGHAVPFISKADLIENKRQTGRSRDIADLEELELLPPVEGWQ